MKNQKIIHKIRNQKITLYQAIISIFNEHFENKIEIITRHELIIQLRMKYDFFERQPIWANVGYPVGCTKYSLSTMDNIRNMLEKVGFLAKVYYYPHQQSESKTKQGWFHIKKQIPSDLTYNKLRNMYNNFQQKLKDYFTENDKQPDDVIYFVLQTKNFLEFYGTKFE